MATGNRRKWKGEKIKKRHRFRCRFGGGLWIRTTVGGRQQIYSLPPLATRAPLRRERMKLLLKDSKLSRVTDKNPAKRYQVAYHDGSTLINTLFNASF